MVGARLREVREEVGTRTMPEVVRFYGHWKKYVDFPEIRLYAHNTIEYPMQLEPIIENDEPDLKITTYPPVLKQGEIAPVDIVFKPDPDRISPLQSGFDFRKIILTRS